MPSGGGVACMDCAELDILLRVYMYESTVILLYQLCNGLQLTGVWQEDAAQWVCIERGEDAEMPIVCPCMRGCMPRALLNI